MARHSKAKLVLELRHKGASQREIAKTRHISRNTVRDICTRADEKGISFTDVADLDDADVSRMLFPEIFEQESLYEQPDFDYVHNELKKTGVTLKLLWEEYADECRQHGKTPSSYTTFSRGYSSYTTSKRITNHLKHKPGQAMEVDWSGSTMAVADPATGEVSKAYIFVAVLPYSQYTYAEACASMKQNAWIRCHIHAFEFFGGTPVRIICDNLKTGVISHPKEGEIILNEAYEALARHYVCAIMPAQIAKPKQKASVEGGVGNIATAVIARLRNETFFSIEELNAAIRDRLDAFNSSAFQKREGSRKLVFEEVERDTLTPLPTIPFEICEWVYGRKVAFDFHISYLTNRYSVPHRLIGRKVDLKVTDSQIEVFDHGERVATHPRFPEFARYRYRTDESHMPPEFMRPEWDKRRILSWARDIGVATTSVIERIFDDVDIKEQAYNPAMAVLNLSKSYGQEELERACAYASEKTSRPRYKFIRSVLASHASERDVRKEDDDDDGGFVRGASYYGGGSR